MLRKRGDVQTDATRTKTETPPRDPGAMSGLLTGVSFIAGVGGAVALADSPYPRPGSEPAEVRRYFTENSRSAQLSATGQLISTASLARFTVSVARLAARSGQGSRGLRAAALAGGGRETTSRHRLLGGAGRNLDGLRGADRRGQLERRWTQCHGTSAGLRPTLAKDLPRGAERRRCYSGGGRQDLEGEASRVSAAAEPFLSFDGRGEAGGGLCPTRSWTGGSDQRSRSGRSGAISSSTCAPGTNATRSSPRTGP